MLRGHSPSGGPDQHQLVGRRTATVQRLNDALRRSLPASGPHSRVMLTAAVAALPADRLASLIEAVRSFNTFTPDNDPYGEHDFGAVDMDGDRYFWKIEAYDRSLTFGSPDPADPTVTTRVLTIMRTDEY